MGRADLPVRLLATPQTLLQRMAVYRALTNVPSRLAAAAGPDAPQGDVASHIQLRLLQTCQDGVASAVLASLMSHLL